MFCLTFPHSILTSLLHRFDYTHFNNSLIYCFIILIFNFLLFFFLLSLYYLRYKLLYYLSLRSIFKFLYLRIVLAKTTFECWSYTSGFKIIFMTLVAGDVGRRFISFLRVRPLVLLLLIFEGYESTNNVRTSYNSNKIVPHIMIL